MTYDYICLTWTWSHEDTGWYLHSKNCKILPSGPPSLSVASARIQFALGPVRWPFQHLDLGIWGREWGVMKEGVFFFVALQIDIGIWHFSIFFPDGPSSGNHHWMIFVQPFLNHWNNHLFGLLGFPRHFFSTNRNWGFSPNWTKVPSNSSIFWPQGVKGQATTNCLTPPRVPEALDDAAPSPANRLRNHPFFIDSTFVWAPFPCQFLSASQFQVLNYLFGSCTSHAIWAWASLHLLLLKALVNINMTHVSQCI